MVHSQRSVTSKSKANRLALQQFRRQKRKNISKLREARDQWMMLLMMATMNRSSAMWSSLLNSFDDDIFAGYSTLQMSYANTSLVLATRGLAEVDEELNHELTLLEESYDDENSESGEQSEGEVQRDGGSREQDESAREVER